MVSPIVDHASAAEWIYDTLHLSWRMTLDYNNDENNHVVEGR